MYGRKIKSTLSDSDSYTPTSADLNTFITVRASLKSTGFNSTNTTLYDGGISIRGRGNST